MKVWSDKLNDFDFQRIAGELGVVLVGPHASRIIGSIPRTGTTSRSAYNFGLRPNPATRDDFGHAYYQRASSSGFHPDRRVNAVCWHGHRDFMRAVFKRDPEARIKTSWADYRGRGDFEAKYPATAYRNIGSMAYPVFANEACWCYTHEI